MSNHRHAQHNTKPKIALKIMPFAIETLLYPSTQYEIRLRKTLIDFLVDENTRKTIAYPRTTQKLKKKYSGDSHPSLSPTNSPLQRTTTTRSRDKRDFEIRKYIRIRKCVYSSF